MLFRSNPRSLDGLQTSSWSVTTVRFGFVLKFGKTTRPIRVAPVVVVTPAPVVIKPAPVVEPTPVIVPVVIVPKVPTTIFFAFDKSKLNKQAIVDLDKLVAELSQTTSTIDIKSYCDIRGTDVYNIKLSERRSKTVVTYLISKGIKSSRIQSEGLGETQSFNKNGTKNTESEYALNRRSDVIIVETK